MRKTGLLIILLFFAILISGCQTASENESPIAPTSTLLASTPTQTSIPPTATPTPMPPTVTATSTLSTTEPSLSAPTVTNPEFTALEMVDQKAGWAITEQAILQTDDGGLTWYNLSMPGVTDLGYGTGFSALDENIAWVLVADSQDPVHTGTLYHTTDGGLNWEPIPVPFGSGKLDFVDATQGWMMLNLGAGAGSMGVSIFRTEDGGLTWSEVYTNDPNQPEAGDSLPLGGLKNNLIAKDGQTVWVAGVIYAPETIYLFKSTDGGQTWAPQTLPAAPSTQNTESNTKGPILLTASDAILPVQFMGETMRTGFYISHDGGQSWDFNTMMPGLGVTDFVSPADGFYWSGEQFFITVDGGATWTAINSNIDFGDTLFLMDFVDPQHGWVVTYTGDNQRTLYTTNDSGTTWVQLTP